MKILYIVHRIPFPPNKGDKIRSFNILKHLSKRHEISLACLVDSKIDLKYIKDLKRYCETIDWVLINRKIRQILSFKALLKKQPLSVHYFYSKKLQNKINHRLQEKNFDVIFSYSSQVAEYVKSFTHIKRIMDFVDIDSRKWKQYALFQKNILARFLYNLESMRLETYEKQIAQSHDVSIFVSETEANIFRNKIYNSKKIIAIHNGVDYNFFKPNQNEKFNNSPIILFTGAMDYYPNIDAVNWFIKEIFPEIKQRISKVKFYIVGRNPCQQLKKVHNGIDIVVTGYVKDIREYFYKANVFIAPFRIACGIQNKILEAFSMGLPVVTTAIGAEGLKKVNCPIQVVDQPIDFALHTCRFLENLEFKNSKSNIFRQWVIDNYDWNKSLVQLDTLLDD